MFLAEDWRLGLGLCVGIKGVGFDNSLQKLVGSLS